MHLLPLWALAIAGWVASVAAAPGPRPQEGEDLLPALKDLARRKRAGTKSNLPYSNYRPLSGMHRYRYPIYRKRSSRPQPQYDYEDDLYIPEPEGDFLDYEESLRGPSLFRERSLQQQDRRKKMLMEDEGFFSDDFVPEKKFLPSPYVVPLVKKDSVYNLANTPYDLQAIGRLYEVGKRDSNSIDPYNLEALQDAHSVDRKSLRPTPTERFYDAIDAIAKKNVYADESDASRVAKLRNFLTSAAGRYWRARDAEETSARDPLIRKKRSVAAPTVAAAAAAANKTNATTDAPLSAKVPARYHAQFSGDRKKRAFSDYFKWDRRKKSQPEEEAQEDEAAQQKRSDSPRDYDDYLTREYFKSIARSVGQKKKRMAYAQFEADKRSSGIDEFLENPSMLQYMQAMLKEAEEKVTSEAEEELGQTDGENENQRLLGNIVVRLDALERMREALGQLEALQEQEERQQEEEEEEAAGQAKRTQALMLPALPHKRQLSTPQEEAAKKRNSLQEASRRMESEARSSRRRMRRGEAALNPIFLGNTREECPVLERILMNCVAVSNEVGDQDRAFLDTCLRHEICYMCGSGLRISGHECDAVLSSSLEAACSSNLDCLGAAGETFNILSDASRYDQDGICTHDPCVRQFLEMR